MPAERWDTCGDDVVAADLYNTYGDHEWADYQRVEDPDDLFFVCDSLLYGTDDRPDRRNYDASELGQRLIVAIVLTRSDGSQLRIWQYGLTGDDAQTAAMIVEGDDSYHLGGYPMAPYVGPDAEVVDRSEVPVP